MGGPTKEPIPTGVRETPRRRLGRRGQQGERRGVRSDEREEQGSGKDHAARGDGRGGHCQDRVRETMLTENEGRAQNPTTHPIPAPSGVMEATMGMYIAITVPKK